MRIIPTHLADLLILEPTIYTDSRGFFFESFNQHNFAATSGFNGEFVQDNHSKSVKHVLRGLHYQIRQPQGKLVRVCAGEVYDVSVDLRRHSPSFGQWFGIHLSADEHRQLWIPPGFAHGFLVLSATAEFLYKTTDYWAAEHERCILWNDPQLAIDWPLSDTPLLSEKDTQGVLLREASLFD